MLWLVKVLTLKVLDTGTLSPVGDELVDPRKLFVCPALGILLSSQLGGLAGIRHKKNHVHETWLVFKDRQDLIANSFGELSDLAGLGRDGHDSNIASSFRIHRK